MREYLRYHLRSLCVKGTICKYYCKHVFVVAINERKPSFLKYRLDAFTFKFILNY